MKNWALGLMSNDEKRSILDQHKSLYNGYRTMQPQVSNTQPLYVQDFANDKGGITVNNKGNVKQYTNMGINEEVEEECVECNDKGYMEESKSTCSECGGVMMEGECSECGWKVGETEEGNAFTGALAHAKKHHEKEFKVDGKKFHVKEETQQVKDLKKVEDLNLSDEFDYVEGEVEETEQGNPYENRERPYSFVSKGPKDSGDAFSIKADDMDLDDEEVQEPFDFISQGAVKEFEQMESAWSDEEIGMEDGEELYPSFDTDGEFKGMSKSSGDMEYEDEDELELDFDKFDPRDKSWEEITAHTGDDEFSHLDEDLKESVTKQKNRIMEMMNRMKGYN